jgi:hypothetical protein
MWLLEAASLVLACISTAQAHSAHETTQQPFSQEQLDDLERKWGIDVLLHSPPHRVDFKLTHQYSGGFLGFQPVCLPNHYHRECLCKFASPEGLSCLQTYDESSLPTIY